MGSYIEKEGCLIEAALQGEFDVICQGCNCYCAQKSGIAVPMSQTFRTNTFRMESPHWKGDYNKLGTIDFARQVIDTHNKCVATAIEPGDRTGYKDLYVVNAYTQYRPGAATKPYSIPLDYDALRMCMRKLNHEFKGLKVGLCKIGCGLAGGDWKIASEIIKQELVDCDVEVLIKD